MIQLSLIKGLSGADFSDDGVYRYQLLRTWDKDKPIFTYVGLNPSVAKPALQILVPFRCCEQACVPNDGSPRMPSGMLFDEHRDARRAGYGNTHSPLFKRRLQ